VRKVALIACVKEKRNFPCKAIELYQSSLFFNWLKAAENQGVDAIYILSGKHGLLHPEEIVAPYEYNLDLASEEELENWSQRVIKKLSLFEDLERSNFYIFSNDIYAKPLFSKLKSVVHFTYKSA
jgi:hypothetical protein